MRTATVAAAASLACLALAATFALAEGDETRTEPRHRVLVELFTSQG